MPKCAHFPRVVLFLYATIAWLIVIQIAHALIFHSPAAVETAAFNFPRWYYESDQASASLGFSVSGAGDVNGDGFEDVVVGAPKYSGTTHKAGTVFAFYGSPGGLQSLPQWRFDGDQTGADLGAAVAAAGDVNGDGFDDVLIAAPRYNHDQSREGRVYAFYGSANGLPSTPDWQIESDLVEAYLGWAVAAAGDVNDDGFGDVIVGAKWAQHSFDNEGMAQLYLGSKTGLASSPAWMVFGGQAGASLGTAVSPAGDINKDGYDDVLVGAPLHNSAEEDAGQALIFCGSATGLDPEPCWSVTGTQPNGRLGEAVSGARDVNGDGYDDLVIGEPGQDAVHLFAGTNAGLPTVPSWTAVSDQSGAQFGTAVHMSSDVNDDGYSDLLIGAYVYSADQSQEGRIFAYYGSITGPATQPDWIAEGNKAEAEFGFALGSSDVDGDGQAELLVGSPNYRKETELRGRAFLFEGLPANSTENTLFLPLIVSN
ncbi:MAG: hypothetical protein CL608_01095 [Anaerolineaceae bacterium]|nr:hypothetical protein [Anaerolineaceae bacterium]